MPFSEETAGGHLSSGTATPVIYYYVVNLQGDVIRLVSTNGASVAQYWYGPYGEVRQAFGAMAEANPLRYRGYYYDADTEFYYLQSRYYDPAICRFINADGIAATGQGFLGCNMFAYCGNNPTNRTDPSGHAWWGTNTVAICDGGTPKYVAEIEKNETNTFPELVPTSQDLYDYLTFYHMIPRKDDEFSEVYISISQNQKLYNYSPSSTFQDIIGSTSTGYTFAEAGAAYYGRSLLNPIGSAATTTTAAIIELIPKGYRPSEGTYLAFTVQTTRKYKIPESVGYTIRTQTTTSTYLWVSSDQVWFECERNTTYHDVYISVSP